MTRNGTYGAAMTQCRLVCALVQADTLMRQGAAGALNKQVWDRMVAEGQVDTSKVKQIWVTPGYVDYVWTARQEVAPGLRDKFKNAFLKLDSAQEKDKVVLALQGATKFVAASPSDFDAIEAVAKSTGLLK